MADLPFSICNAVTNHRIRLNSTLKMDTKMNSLVRSRFFQLRFIFKLKLILSRKHLEFVTHAFITSCPHYSNSFAGVNTASIAHLQLVSAARFLTEVNKKCHTTSILSLLHWLPIQFRVQVILFLIKPMNSVAPPYQSELFLSHQPAAPSGLPIIFSCISWKCILNLIEKEPLWHLQIHYGKSFLLT